MGRGKGAQAVSPKIAYFVRLAENNDGTITLVVMVSLWWGLTWEYNMSDVLTEQNWALMPFRRLFLMNDH